MPPELPGSVARQMVDWLRAERDFHRELLAGARTRAASDGDPARLVQYSEAEEHIAFLDAAAVLFTETYEDVLAE